MSGTHRKAPAARVGIAARVACGVEAAQMLSGCPHTAGRRRIADPRDVRRSVRSAPKGRPTRPRKRLVLGLHAAALSTLEATHLGTPLLLVRPKT
ncbi:MAG: hypothetical protein AAB403_14430, partial [Planctomycetota bacterium]